MTDIVYLCAACASSFAEALRLERLPDSKAERDTCLLCNRLCYGDRYAPKPRTKPSPTTSPAQGEGDRVSGGRVVPSPLPPPPGEVSRSDGGGVPQEVPHG